MIVVTMGAPGHGCFPQCISGADEEISIEKSRESRNFNRQEKVEMPALFEFQRAQLNKFSERWAA